MTGFLKLALLLVVGFLLFSLVDIRQLMLQLLKFRQNLVFVMLHFHGEYPTLKIPVLQDDTLANERVAWHAQHRD